MPTRTRFGILTPSSNTALEPLTTKLLEQLPEVSVHYSRFRVLEIALSESALAQFDNGPIIEAAKLLADAKVDVIGWSGTSSGWLGFDRDEKLCSDITAATGIPATTSVLGLNRILARMNITSMSLLTPYTHDVQAAIIRTYRQSGVDCDMERHLEMYDNASFGNIPVSTFDEEIKSLSTEGARVISIFCTGLRTAHRVPFWEAEYNILVLDTVSTVVWDMLMMAGVDLQRIQGWGRLFSESSNA